MSSAGLVFLCLLFLFLQPPELIDKTSTDSERKVTTSNYPSTHEFTDRIPLTIVVKKLTSCDPDKDNDTRYFFSVCSKEFWIFHLVTLINRNSLIKQKTTPAVFFLHESKIFSSVLIFDVDSEFFWCNLWKFYLYFSA